MNTKVVIKLKDEKLVVDSKFGDFKQFWESFDVAVLKTASMFFFLVKFIPLTRWNAL